MPVGRAKGRHRRRGFRRHPHRSSGSSDVGSAASIVAPATSKSVASAPLAVSPIGCPKGPRVPAIHEFSLVKTDSADLGCELPVVRPFVTVRRIILQWTSCVMNAPTIQLL
jgi:hypothetical protein